MELVVGTPLTVGLLQGPVVAYGDQGVLEPVALPDVVVDVVGGDDARAQPAGQPEQEVVARPVAVDQVSLELEEDVVGAEPVQVVAGPGLGVLGLALDQEGGDRAPGAAGQEDEALGVTGEEFGVEPGVEAVAADAGVGDEVAQVGVALPRLGQEGEVGAVLEGDLGPGYGLDAQAGGGAGELHGAAQVVVVGEGQGAVAEIASAGQQPADGGGPLLEGVVAVAVELDVCVRGHRGLFGSWLFALTPRVCSHPARPTLRVE